MTRQSRGRERMVRVRILAPVRRIVAVTGSIVFLDAMLFGAIIRSFPGSPTTTT